MRSRIIIAIAITIATSAATTTAATDAASATAAGNGTFNALAAGHQGASTDSPRGAWMARRRRRLDARENFDFCQIPPGT